MLLIVDLKEVLEHVRLSVMRATDAGRVADMLSDITMSYSVLNPPVHSNKSLLYQSTIKNYTAGNVMDAWSTGRPP